MKPTVIHMTDLYHTHNDPDDHWDVACEYALHYRGDINLIGICCDGKFKDYGDPAIDSIAQMNYIVNDAVPVGIGGTVKIKDENVMKEILSQPVNGSVKLILKTLENSPTPVAIHVCGSCRDIAVAGRLRPDLFERNCLGIYLNAGSTEVKGRVEWNVWLDSFAYTEVFKIPCKKYWLPCLHIMPVFEESEDSSFFNMPQSEVLPYLSENVKKYFLYMFEHVRYKQYLEYMYEPLDTEKLEIYCQKDRQMYCPPGFLHCAGYGVDKDGNLIERDDENSVFRFVPVKVDIEKESGMLNGYELCEKSDIYMISHKKDIYGPAMVRAMKNLLTVLP